MVLDRADQELMNSLRAKYQEGGSIDTLKQHYAGANKVAAAAWANEAATDNLAHVNVCHICHGSGLQTELYEFRRLERTCLNCHGQGVSVTGGQSSSDQSRGSEQGSKRMGTEKAWAVSTADPEAKQRRHAEWRAAQLQQKIDKVNQEKAGMIAALTAGSDSGSAQQTLQENVVEQLQAYLDSLKAAHAASMLSS